MFRTSAGGLELAVKDNELPPSVTSSDLDHHCHMGIAGFGFAIATCLVLIGCGVSILRRRFGCKTSAQPFEERTPGQSKLFEVPV